MEYYVSVYHVSNTTVTCHFMGTVPTTDTWLTLSRKSSGLSRISPCGATSVVTGRGVDSPRFIYGRGVCRSQRELHGEFGVRYVIGRGGDILHQLVVCSQVHICQALNCSGQIPQQNTWQCYLPVYFAHGSTTPLLSLPSRQDLPQQQRSLIK